MYLKIIFCYLSLNSNFILKLRLAFWSKQTSNSEPCFVFLSPVFTTPRERQFYKLLMYYHCLSFFNVFGARFRPNTEDFYFCDTAVYSHHSHYLCKNLEKHITIFICWYNLWHVKRNKKKEFTSIKKIINPIRRTINNVTILALEKKLLILLYN